MSESRQSVNYRWLLVGAVVLGMLVRLVHLIMIDYSLPYLGGGLFAEFTRQIIEHHYALPRHIAFYTDGGIDFAYPPLPFYIEALLIDVFSLTPFEANNVLPPILAALTLPSFYVLVRVLRLSLRAQLAALLAFAVMPMAFVEMVGGERLGDSASTLVMIWLGVAVVRAHKSLRLRDYTVLGIAWAINVVGGPGTAFISVPFLGLFAVVEWWQSEQRWRTFGLLGYCWGVAVVLSAPFWLTVIHHHGVGLFSSSTAGRLPLVETVFVFFVNLFTFRISQSYFPLWDVLILTGFVYALLIRKWAIPVCLLILMALPHDGSQLSSVPAALLVGMVVGDWLGPAITDLWRRIPSATARWLGPTLMIYATLITIITPVYDIVRLMRQNEDEKVNHEALAALEWVDDNLPPDARLIVLSSYDLIDWSPYVARRTVINMPYGTEWRPAEARRVLRFRKLIDECTSLDCIWASMAEVDYNYEAVYLYVSREWWETLTAYPCADGQATQFDPLFENEEAVIGWFRPRASF